MIVLEDVKIRRYNFTDNRSIINDADNMKRVINIVKRHPEIEWGYVNDDIDYCLKKLNKSNFKNKEKIIYKTRGYDDESLSYNDKKNKGEVLLINNPTGGYSVMRNSVSDLTIGDIKSDLKCVLPNGKNFVVAKYRDIGVDRIQKLIESIEYYEKQIERQAALTDNRSCNLFKLNHNEKKKIVLESYKDILELLLLNDRLIWGEVTDNQRKMYYESFCDKSKRGQKTKEKVIEMITNYTTIDELESFKNGNEKAFSGLIG